MPLITEHILHHKTLGFGSAGSNPRQINQDQKPKPMIDKSGGSGPLASFTSERKNLGRSEEHPRHETVAALRELPVTL